MEKGDPSDRLVYAEDLTWREQEVLQLLSERLTNREIAERLHLAESTVKDYVAKIFSKLYVKNRRQAVERAKSLGLLDKDRSKADSPQVNLPTESTPFVGRRDELQVIKRQLGQTRMLTLTGPGGIGKTRLALRTAAELAAEFSHGCFFISLAPIQTSEHLIQTIAEGVNFPLATSEDPQHQLLRYLRNRQLLLVMDNFEHLLDGAGIISKILQVAPEVKILATTRERLNLQSETIIVVGGMDHPGSSKQQDALNFDAVRLFVQNARKVRPGYDPTNGDLRQIVGICQTVQGMPLAIELAAAWLYMLNVDEIAEELEAGIDILASEARDAPQRHRSIEAVFDHSWSMLNQPEQDIVMRLSVFRGGFTRFAAQKVTGSSLSQLTGLINKSFLSHDPGTGRLKFHEMLRQYIYAKLEQTPQANISAREAHAAYYADFMAQSWPDLKGARQMRAIAEIEADIENVRTAWRYYLNQRNAPQMQLFIHSFREVYWIRGWNHAGMELFREAVRALQGQADEQSVKLHALLMAHQGYFLSWLGLSEQGYELAQKSVQTLEQFNQPAALAFALESIAINSYCLNLFFEEIAGKDRLLKIAVEIDDQWLLALAYFEASMTAVRNKDYHEARRLAEASLKLNEQTGNQIRTSLSLLPLGHAAMGLGEYEKAAAYYQRCLELSQGTGFLWGTEKGYKYLGKVALSTGRIAVAEQYLLESLHITNEIGLTRDKLNLLYEYACLLVDQGNSEQAVELLALVLQHPTSLQVRLGAGRIRDSARSSLGDLEAEIPPETYAAALERGQELDLDEVIIKLLGPAR